MIRHISTDALRGLTQLKILYIDQNPGLSMFPNIAHVCGTLEELIVRFNNISSIPDIYMINCTKIVKFIMHDNILYSVPNLSSMARTIKYIDLADNRIHSIGILGKVSFPCLSYIGLGNNQISVVPCSAFWRWPSVSQLSISRNRLTSLPCLDRSVWPALRSGNVGMTVNHNPWECDRNMSWMLRCSTWKSGCWICKQGLKIVDSERMCRGPAEFAGLPFSHPGTYCVDAVV